MTCIFSCIFFWQVYMLLLIWFWLSIRLQLHSSGRHHPTPCSCHFLLALLFLLQWLSLPPGRFPLAVCLAPQLLVCILCACVSASCVLKSFVRHLALLASAHQRHICVLLLLPATAPVPDPSPFHSLPGPGTPFTSMSFRVCPFQLRICLVAWAAFQLCLPSTLHPPSSILFPPQHPLAFSILIPPPPRHCLHKWLRLCIWHDSWINFATF